MKIHLRFDETHHDHTHCTLFIDTEPVGTLCMSPPQSIWLASILDKGCKALSPQGREPIAYWTTGTQPLACGDNGDTLSGRAHLRAAQVRVNGE